MTSRPSLRSSRMHWTPGPDMFVIRNAIHEDVSQLLDMARTVHSNNLPPDADALGAIVEQSMKSFNGEASLDERTFTFVLVDDETGSVAGTSAIMARRGTPARPRLYLKVRRYEHYSEDLQDGQVQATVQLMQDVDGVTEVGGLVLPSAYRGNGKRLGSMLSRVRFSFMGLHPDWFMERVVAEVMGVLTDDCQTKLWEHLGRRFINLSYQEADVFSRTSKEFITSLFPKEEIYISLMPPEARQLIGAVSPDATPALHMLRELGFEEVDEVDPFDGGPYLSVHRDAIPLVAATKIVKLGPAGTPEGPEGFASVRVDGSFRCVRCPFTIEDDLLTLPAEAMDALQVTPGDTVGCTPEHEHAGAVKSNSDVVPG